MRETPSSRADTIKRRFAYDEWPSRCATRNALFIWNVRLRGDELPGMVMDRVKSIESASITDSQSRSTRAAIRDASTEAPRLHVQSIWRDAADPEVIVRVDIFECTSDADAREKAVWMLGEFESPMIDPAEGVGDVAFASRGDGLILFVRANLVCLLRNIGLRSASMRTASQALDFATLGIPGAEGRAVTPVQIPTEGDDSQTVEATLQSAAPESSDYQLSRKFTAPAGEISLRDGAILFRGPRSALERVTSCEYR